MDPVSGWPFFVDHPNRRTTWHDPRFSYTCRPWALPDPDPSNYFSPFPVSPANWWSAPTSDFFRPPSQRSKKEPRRRSLVTKSSETKQPPKLSTNVSPDPHSGVTVQYPKLQDLSPKELTPEKTEASEESKPEPTENSEQEDQVELEQEDQETKSEVEENRVPQSEVDAQLTKIKNIAAQVEALRNDVGAFSGEAGSKRYIFLEESLMNQLLALDSTETFGLSQIRSSRKKVTTDIQNLLAQLESQAVS